MEKLSKEDENIITLAFKKVYPTLKDPVSMKLLREKIEEETGKEYKSTNYKDFVINLIELENNASNEE